VWINATNLFDAAAGFGGYRESGFGREGGREGMYEYLRPAWERAAKDAKVAAPTARRKAARAAAARPAVDRTPKLFIGGKQRRPDGGYSRKVVAPDGSLLAEVGEGNRKDIRDAVEAAHAAAGWGRGSGHARAQILYYVGENLTARAAEFAARIDAMTGVGRKAAAAEVEASVARLFTYAAWADKWDGAVHQVPIRGVTLAMHEPVGVLGIAAPETAPLLGFLSLVAPAIALGNTVVAVPSSAHPLAATDLYSVLETSDLPAGVVNIVTGDRGALARVLAEHFDVDGVWFFGAAGDRAAVKAVEEASAGNLKRTWTSLVPRDWTDVKQGEGREFLRRATEVKNIWIPYGE
jgi:aldehyde dehydrogenase (NAD+)